MSGPAKTVLMIFSLGMSLTRWKQMGILEKEMLVFSSYLSSELAGKILLFTYDNADQKLLTKAQQRGEISRSVQLIPAPYWVKYKLGKVIYSLVGPLSMKRYFMIANVLINNQTSGAWTGLIAQCLLKKRFVYRYGHSLWRRHLDRKQFTRLVFSWSLDRLLTRYSSHTLVCTKKDYQYANKTKNVQVCPNFIDTFGIIKQRRAQWELRQERGVFVGRLIPVKNLFNLISACAECSLPIDIVGDGELRQRLELHAKNISANCRFLGVLPNEQIRVLLPGYKYFFLVSNFEGMPKALLEGMASCCTCIVSPHYSCAEIIDDETNGLITSNYTEGAIVDTINRSKRLDRFNLGCAAQEKVTKKYSLIHIMGIHRKALAFPSAGCIQEGL